MRALSFTARLNGRGTLLHWRMGSEAGLLGYVVERNGVRLNGALILAGRGSYSFRDRRPGLRPRYTLFAVGLDGRRVRLATAAA